MKKLWLLILPILICTLTVNAGDGKNTNAGIKFDDVSWAQVAKKAAKENKLVFMDIYTTWCGPCKLLRKTTFTDKAVGDYFNAHFVNTSVDAEKGEGLQIAEKYNIQGYPTLLILDKDGKEIGRQVGYMPAEGLLRFGQSVVK